jgi:serine/threonine protein kinase
LKILKKEHLVSTKNVRNIINERRLLSEINNNFIVKLRFTFQSSEKLFMAFDYHNGGELFYHLQKKKRFSEDEVKIYSAEIYLALSYLHSKNIVYRDIKPENIILDKTGHIKLVDFGLAKKLSSKELFTSSFCGTNEYIRKYLSF